MGNTPQLLFSIRPSAEPQIRKKYPQFTGEKKLWCAAQPQLAKKYPQFTEIAPQFAQQTKTVRPQATTGLPKHQLSDGGGPPPSES